MTPYFIDDFRKGDTDLLYDIFGADAGTRSACMKDGRVGIVEKIGSWCVCAEADIRFKNCINIGHALVCRI